MKEKWSILPISRRILCAVNALIAIVFFVIYLTAGSRIVLRYDTSILDAARTDSSFIFTGEVEGKAAEFILSSDMVLTYTLDGVEYGPFSIVDDPSAVPQESVLDVSFYKGIEILEDGEPIFRGGYYKYTGAGILLVAEDGTYYSDPAEGEPDLHIIVHFTRFASAVRQGNWLFLAIGIIFTLLILLTGFFIEPFFRANMPRTKEEKEENEKAKPSAFRVTLSWIGWTFLTIGSLFFYVGGLMAY